MLTLFASCKRFSGEDAVQQTNAIRSWHRLAPELELILFGKETEAIAGELGIRHIMEVERNEFGTQLVHGMFDAVRRASETDLIGFVNADMILLEDLLPAVRRAKEAFPSFLLTARRRTVDAQSPIDFEDPAERERLRAAPLTPGHFGLDIGIFTKDLFTAIPPLTIGHFMWDSWLVFECRRLGIPVVDATACLSAVHQEHRRGPWDINALGPEDQRNLDLAGGLDKKFSAADATHLMDAGAIRPARTIHHLVRMIYALPVLRPWLAPLLFPLRAVIELSRSARIRLGLTLPSQD